MVHQSPVLFSERLLHALSTIHATPPRLISVPGPPSLPTAGGKPARGKRASVAISQYEHADRIMIAAVLIWIVH